MEHEIIQGAGMYSLDRSEALRYLGYNGQEIDSTLAETIDRVFALCEEASRPAWVYTVLRINKTDVLALEDSTIILEGHDIAKHLNGACYCAVMAATCGAENERELKKLGYTNSLEKLVFDAAGSSLIEVVADACNAAIVEKAHSMGLYTSWRYSPGYGDLTLSVQTNIIESLEAQQRIGLHLTSSGILIPTKSITALIGFFPSPQETNRICTRCTLKPYCKLAKTNSYCNAENN